MEPADGIGMLDRQACQVAAGLLPGGDQNAFAFNRHGVRNQHTAGPKRRLRGFDDAGRQPAANEDGIGRRKIGNTIRRKTGNGFET